MEYVIARRLGRTHAELLDTISARELVWQKALEQVEAEEHNEAAREAAKAQRGR